MGGVIYIRKIIEVLELIFKGESFENRRLKIDF